MSARGVIAGFQPYSVRCMDCLDWLADLPADSVDLVFGSGPYEAQRTYSMGFNLKGQAFVDWMVEVFRAALRVCRGLVAFVLEGFTKQFRWSATPALLMADLHRAGINLRKPPAFHRVGIAGSGGPDWLRNDYEFIVCATRPGKLPWSDNTACGHEPKWAPGGAMSHRHSDGRRANANASKACQERMNLARPSNVNQWGHSINSGATVQLVDGRVRSRGRRPAHRLGTATRGGSNGDTKTVSGVYDPPVKANPGNVIKCLVGGGVMGHDLCHENEAPFPLKLASFFVQSFCPPGGIVADPFIGSGTTLHAAIDHGRRFIGCDVRQSQVDLSLRRARSVIEAKYAGKPA